MLDRFIHQGRVAALRHFGLHKIADDMAGPSMGLPGAAGPSLGDRARAFGQGQWGAAKDLFGNLRQGLGGAATPELGMAARQAVGGNLRTLAPSLLAGGAAYMFHRHNQAKRQQQAQQQAMMMQGY